MCMHEKLSFTHDHLVISPPYQALQNVTKIHEINCSNSEIFRGRTPWPPVQLLQAYSSATKVGKSATSILILHTLAWPLGRRLYPSTSRINSAQRPHVFRQRHWLAIHWLQPSLTVRSRRAASSLAPSHPLPYTSAGGSAVGHQILSGCPLMIHWRQRL